MKAILHILALIALLAVYHTAGVLWGRDAKLYLLIGMLALYAFVGLALLIMRRRLRSVVQHMDEVNRAELLREHPEVADQLAPNAGVPWRWKVRTPFRAVSDTVPGQTGHHSGMTLKLSDINRNAVRYESEPCPTSIGMGVRHAPEYATGGI